MVGGVPCVVGGELGANYAGLHRAGGITEAGILLAHKDNRVESPQFVGWNCLNLSTSILYFPTSH